MPKIAVDYTVSRILFNLPEPGPNTSLLPIADAFVDRVRLVLHGAHMTYERFGLNINSGQFTSE